MREMISLFAIVCLLATAQLSLAIDGMFESPFIDCPRPCTCFSTASGDIHVNCEAPIFIGSSNVRNQYNGEEIDFHMLPHNATEISVYRGSGLQTLPGRSFTPFRALTSLEIRLSDLRDVDEMAFAGLRKLRILNLRLNAIRSLSRNVFRQTLWLTELRLDENIIEDLPDGIFDHLRTLRFLDLSNNRLNNIRPGIFAGLSLLQDLRLGRNRIIELDGPSFGSLSNLQSLDLSGNQLKRISGPAFANLTTLNKLDLSSNQLSFVDPSSFSGIQDTVKQLHLCDNPWICDCALLPLKRWIDSVKPDQASPSVGVVFDKPPKANQGLCRTTCRLPNLVSGASLVNMREASVYCPTTTTTTTTTTTRPLTTAVTSLRPGSVNLKASSTSLADLLLLAPPSKIINIKPNNATRNSDGGSNNGDGMPTTFDMTISVAVSVAVAGVLIVLIIVSLVAYHVRKCQAKRRRYKQHPQVIVGTGSALANGSMLGSGSGSGNGVKATLYPGYGTPYIGDITSGGGSTGSDLVSDSKSDSSAGTPNGMNYQQQQQQSQPQKQPNSHLSTIYTAYGADQWQVPSSSYLAASSSSSTTMLGGYPASLHLNPMPGLHGLTSSSAMEHSHTSYPTSISLNFPQGIYNAGATSTPAKPASFIGGHDIMTSSFPPPPPQSAITILDMHNDNIVGQANNLKSSSRSESLV